MDVFRGMHYVRLTAQIGYGYLGFNFTMRPSSNYGLRATGPLINQSILPDNLAPELLDQLRSVSVNIPNPAPLINETIQNIPQLLETLQSIGSKPLISKAMLPDLELSLKNGNVAIGSVEARAESRTGFSLLFRGQGIASKKLSISTPDEMFVARNWDGSDPEWWTVEGNIGYRITPTWSALVGLRRERLSMSLAHPQPTGLPVTQIPGILEVSPAIGSGSLSSNLWLPYFGLEFIDQRYRASLLWAPFASSDIQILVHHSVPVSVLPPLISGTARVGFRIQGS